MRKLIGRAGPLLIFAPSRVAEGGSRAALAPAARQPAAGAEGEITRTDPERAAAPTLAGKLEQALAAALGRRRGPSAIVEDLWDPAGVPGRGARPARDRDREPGAAGRLAAVGRRPALNRAGGFPED